MGRAELEAGPWKGFDSQRSAKAAFVPGSNPLRTHTRPPRNFPLRQWRPRPVIGTSKQKSICVPLRFLGLAVWHSLDGYRNRDQRKCEKGVSELAGREPSRGGLGDVAMEDPYDARCAQASPHDQGRRAPAAAAAPSGPDSSIPFAPPLSPRSQITPLHLTHTYVHPFHRHILPLPPILPVQGENSN